MIVSNRGSVFGLLFWQWRNVLLFTIAAILVYTGYNYSGLVFQWNGWKIDLQLPGMPLAVVGAALGIFVSFRTNSAYDRWWEGRKLWGRLINSSRHFCTQVLSYVDSEGGRHRKEIEQIVRRHIAYVHVLRCGLRQQDSFADASVKEFLEPDEYESLKGSNNLNHALLQLQQDQLVRLADAGVIDHFRLQSMDRTIAALLDIQGGCERIKKTPMPRGYGFIAERLILVYGCMFPLAVVHQLGILVIPINVLVCLSFALISEAGRVLEDPFTMYYNGLPLSALSSTIELNLRQRLGETELPAMPTPDERGILM